MASLVRYKGLSVLDAPVGPGGTAIDGDLTALADRIGPCNYSAAADPTSAGNQSAGYYAGSRWFNAAAGTEWVCLASGPAAATWALTTAAAELALKAPLASPAFTGTPTAPTAAGGTNTTQLATTAFVQAALGSYLPLGGGTMAGLLNANSTVRSTGLTDPASGSGIEVHFNGTSGQVFSYDPSGHAFLPTSIDGSKLVLNGYGGGRTLVGTVTDDGAHTLQVSGSLSLATALGAAYGGTGAGTYALGDTLYSSAADTLAKLPGNTTATRKFLRQAGTGSASAAPAWDGLAAADVPDLSSTYLPLAGGTMAGTIALDAAGASIAGDGSGNVNFGGKLSDTTWLAGSALMFSGSSPYMNDGSGTGGGTLYMDGGTFGGPFSFFGAAPVGQQTGGAATAGNTYTATEKGMIQRMYDALRAYGLLT